MWIEKAKLTAHDGAHGDHFGFSVALDGDAVAIGAPYDDADYDYQHGSAYIFKRTPGGWQQEVVTTGERTPFSVAFVKSATV